METLGFPDPPLSSSISMAAAGSDIGWRGGVQRWWRNRGLIRFAGLRRRAVRSAGWESTNHMARVSHSKVLSVEMKKLDVVVVGLRTLAEPKLCNTGNDRPGPTCSRLKKRSVVEASKQDVSDKRD